MRIVIICLFATAVLAETPLPIRQLMAEPVTLWDMGMMRVEQAFRGKPYLEGWHATGAFRLCGDIDLNIMSVLKVALAFSEVDTPF
jgi:hypothetical protein